MEIDRLRKQEFTKIVKDGVEIRGDEYKGPDTSRNIDQIQLEEECINFQMGHLSEIVGSTCAHMSLRM